ncbi:hypothetical protein [Actibacterium sp. MT2.3-13A]|uniref:hypothetical protein n=1 Tax=Actibacterium sp. MT2.3-13A TaxID=2828332 RepID=UPI001BABF6A7|nr:hypothetical protein [Actibacterium sp. MT2.3-13A]
MRDHADYPGLAALSIREAPLPALSDHEPLPESEIVGILRDAAATHENAIGTDPEGKMHQAVAELINRIIAGGSSFRRR